MTISGSASSLKRELRLGVYAKLREQKYALKEDWLRDQYVQWLAPTRQDGRDAMPLAIKFCDNDGAASLLVSEVNKIIEQKHWHELALILRELKKWSMVTHKPGAERPWWVLQASSTSHQEGVAEVIDASREAAPPQPAAGCSCRSQ